MSESTPPYAGEDAWKNVRYADEVEHTRNRWGISVSMRRGLPPYERLSIVETNAGPAYCCDGIAYEAPRHAYAAWIFSKPERPGR